MGTLYCGIDLHSNNGVYAVTDENDKVLYKKRLNNDLASILAALEPFREELDSVAVESSVIWYWLGHGLSEAGYPVRLANPAQIDQFDGLKHADDDTDALFLAQLSRLDILPTGYIYPKEERPSRDLLRRRMLLVQHRTALILSVQNLFSRQLGRSLGWRAVGKLLPSDLEELLRGDDMLVFTVSQQLRLIRTLCETISNFERKILETNELKPDYELLLSMPGVGKILGLTIMFETGDIGRFPKVGNYTSYCRCARAKHESNHKKKSDNNRKNGNRYLSWAYVEAAHHAIRTCQPARKWYQRKMARTNGAVATKALASKWSKAAYYILTRGEPFDIRRVFG